ncbi:hypothetical protein [Bacillus dakarensis]|uniref:hypothetical protein n=1 Tax=Robertmurraya dakarensis TaxID=1926278 RepID=UPI00098203B1|nr:hypothetical protein [Bacillus dakarensis]
MKTQESKKVTKHLEFDNRAYWEGFHAGRASGHNEAIMKLTQSMMNLSNHKGIGQKTVDKFLAALNEEMRKSN